jgi:hypothetical protein
MTNPMLIRVTGLLVATFLAVWAFGSFWRLWHGWYSEPDAKGKASFCTFRTFATQGTIALIGAALLVYLSLRHY